MSASVNVSECRLTRELSASYETFLPSLSTVAEKCSKMPAASIYAFLTAARLGVRLADWSVTLRCDWCISIRI